MISIYYKQIAINLHAASHSKGLFEIHEDPDYFNDLQMDFFETAVLCVLFPEHSQFVSGVLPILTEDSLLPLKVDHLSEKRALEIVDFLQQTSSVENREDENTSREINSGRGELLVELDDIFKRALLKIEDKTRLKERLKEELENETGVSIAEKKVFLKIFFDHCCINCDDLKWLLHRMISLEEFLGNSQKTKAKTLLRSLNRHKTQDTINWALVVKQMLSGEYDRALKQCVELAKKYTKLTRLISSLNSLVLAFRDISK
ncbi:hypothetical protein ACFL96_19720, partial [Thermoproteota archaeon]